ncbi:MAG: hypothetical protein IPK26_03150 [Planctomycetes bacterium]|nr:hypothetical protein [Planctomycetota bacterium]
MNRPPRAGASTTLFLVALATVQAAGQSWQTLDYAVPTTTAAWDGTRQRLLLIGADTRQRLYEWDGARVLERVGQAGEPVVQHLFVDHDPTRMRALSATGAVGTWSGSGWTWQTGGTPTWSNPPTSMTYDPARRRLVVHAGSGSVFEWDGWSWRQVRTNGPSSLQAGAAFAWDPVSRRCICHGGASTAHAETWAWDGFAWSQLYASAPPGPRAGARLGLDPTTRRLLLHGGSTVTDTWSWDGSSWSLLPTTNPPPPVADALFVADDVGLLLLPTQGADRGRIWRLRSGTWQLAGELWQLPTVRPHTRFAYDRARSYFVSCSGGSNLPAADRTLVFDGRWRFVNPTNSPSARSLAMLAWSEIDQRVLLFGGLATTVLAETWSWDGTDWQLRQAAASPSPRYDGAMTEDPAGGILLFGGTDGPRYFGDHWYWDGLSWTQVTPPGLPAARAYAAAAYDPVRRQVVMLGGYSNVAIHLGETQVWNGTSWTQATTSVQPTDPTSATFRPDTGRILAAGQYAAFEWTGSDWLPVPGLGHRLDGFARMATDWRRGVACVFDAPIVRRLGVASGMLAYGNDCALGSAPSLAAIAAPTPGSPFAVELGSRQPAAMTFLTVGLAAQSVAIGANCRSVVAMPVATSALLGDTAGIARFPIPVPAAPSLRGMQFFTQGAVWNPAESPIGSVTLTRGLQVTLGDW